MLVSWLGIGVAQVAYACRIEVIITYMLATNDHSTPNVTLLLPLIRGNLTLT